jgi:peptidoglycan/LPS O-acetylase OafA/YrhL
MGTMDYLRHAGTSIPWFREMTLAPINTAVHIVAKYSYGIYLTHVAALKVSFGMLYSEPLFIQIFLFVSMAGLLPLAAYHLIESPMIKMGRRVARNQFRGDRPTLVSAA